MKLFDIKARDGVLIPCGAWNAAGDIIVYIHGIESHMGWFSPMAEKLQNREIAVYAFDRRGSGLSKEYKGHVDGYKILLDDIGSVIRFIRNERPGKKIYLMGACAGAKFAAAFAGTRSSAIDGLIFMSPAIRTKVTLGLWDKIDAAVSSFLNPKKKIPAPLRDEMFTKSKRFLKFIKNDTLKLRSLSAGFYRELTVMDFLVSGKVRKIKLPILTLLAEDDRIVDNRAMKIWHGKLETADKALKLFENCCHFLPFEENVDEIAGFVAGWIKKRKRPLG